MIELDLRAMENVQYAAGRIAECHELVKKMLYEVEADRRSPIYLTLCSLADQLVDMDCALTDAEIPGFHARDENPNI